VVLISESHDDSNQCIPYRGKLDQHATRFSRSVHVWPATIRISQGPHIATFLEVINSDGQSHCSWEKGLLTQFTAWRLTDLRVCTQFLSRASHWSSGGKATLCWRQAIRFTGPIYQHVIGTFNTYSWGPTYRSLTDTSKGYNLRCIGFPHTTPRPSQPTISTFYLRALLDLQFNQVLPTKQMFEFKKLMAAPMVFRPLDHLPWPTSMPSHS
jgi:hypothetical protein